MLNTCCAPGLVLGTENTALGGTGGDPCHHGASIQVQESENFFDEGLESKYFRLCTSDDLCQNYLALPSYHETYIKRE